MMSNINIQRKEYMQISVYTKAKHIAAGVYIVELKYRAHIKIRYLPVDPSTRSLTNSPPLSGQVVGADTSTRKRRC